LTGWPRIVSDFRSPFALRETQVEVERLAQPFGAGHVRDQHVVLERALDLKVAILVARQGAVVVAGRPYGYPCSSQCTPTGPTGRRPRFRPASDQAGEPMRLLRAAYSIDMSLRHASSSRE
jgi:hypothetical protein